MTATSSDLKRVYDEALRLPQDDRAALAVWLIDSLDPEADADLEAAWGAEIERRLAELDSGAVTPIPLADARKVILGSCHGTSAG
jgi:putative addiction module component (TIGR02574 family)